MKIFIQSRGVNKWGCLGALFLLFLIFILGLLGWVRNIIQLAQMKTFSGVLIIKAFGIVILPLGAIMGWI